MIWTKTNYVVLGQLWDLVQFRFVKNNKIQEYDEYLTEKGRFHMLSLFLSCVLYRLKMHVKERRFCKQ